MIPFISTAELLETLAACLHRPDAGQLIGDAPFWLQHARDAIESTAFSFGQMLSAGGWCPWQIAEWADTGAAAPLFRDLALLDALQRGGGLEQIEEPFLQYLERKRDLVQAGFVLYDAAGLRIVPACGGKVNHGEQKPVSQFLYPVGYVYPRPWLPDYAARFKPW